MKKNEVATSFLKLYSKRYSSGFIKNKPLLFQKLSIISCLTKKSSNMVFSPFKNDVYAL